MNATEFCKKYGLNNTGKIKDWFEKGYLGKTTQNRKTLEYSIPDDTPLPFNADPRVSRLSTLMRDMLEAASQGCSLFPSMYPKIANDTFDRIMGDFVDNKMIRICCTESGCKHLELRPAGLKFMTEVDSKERDNKFKNIRKLLLNGMSLAQALARVWPVISEYIL